MEYIRITWETLERDCITLAKSITEPIDEIVAIARGGVVVGRILSDLLACPMTTITITSYADLTQAKEPVITQPLTHDLVNKKVLLVDEICDSGKTLITATNYLQSLGITTYFTAAPYVRPHAKMQPNFFVKMVHAWVIFPYEIFETQIALGNMLSSQKEANETLHTLGVEEWELHA